MGFLPKAGEENLVAMIQSTNPTTRTDVLSSSLFQFLPDTSGDGERAGPSVRCDVHVVRRRQREGSGSDHSCSQEVAAATEGQLGGPAG